MRQAFKRCCLYKPVETFTKIFLPTFTGPNHLKSKLIYACHRGLVATPGEIMKIAKIILSLAAMGLSCAQAAPADDIRNLLEAGKHAEAYQMGRQHSSEFGQPVFDFYYGIAALDGGSPGEGVLALERFLLAAPANRSARFHLARGYYILGEDQRARAEFSDLQQTAEGDEQLAIQRFLDAIRGREWRYMPSASAYAELGFGRDTNINAGANTGNVAGLPGFTVSSAGTSARQADNFSTLVVGAQGTLPLSPGLMLYGGLQGNGRWQASRQNDIFDQTGLLAQGGVTLITGRNLYRAGLEVNQLTLDNQNYLQVASLLGEWARQLDQFNRLALNLQYSQLRYDNIPIFLDKQKTQTSPSAADNRNGSLSLLSATWTHSFTSPWNPVLTLGLSYGEERNDRGYAEYARNIAGARASLSIQPAEKWSLSASLAYQNSRYRDYFAGNASYPKRNDDFTSLELGINYALSRQWALRAEAIRVDQQANIGLYDYTRNIVAIKLRYDYR